MTTPGAQLSRTSVFVVLNEFGGCVKRILPSRLPQNIRSEKVASQYIGWWIIISLDFNFIVALNFPITCAMCPVTPINFIFKFSTGVLPFRYFTFIKEIVLSVSYNSSLVPFLVSFIDMLARCKYALSVTITWSSVASIAFFFAHILFHCSKNCFRGTRLRAFYHAYLFYYRFPPFYFFWLPFSLFF